MVERHKDHWIAFFDDSRPNYGLHTVTLEIAFCLLEWVTNERSKWLIDTPFWKLEVIEILDQGKSCVPFQQSGCFLDSRLFWQINTWMSGNRYKNDAFFFKSNRLEEGLHLRDYEFISLLGPFNKVHLVYSYTHLLDAKTSSQNYLLLRGSTLNNPIKFWYVSINNQYRRVCLGATLYHIGQEILMSWTIQDNKLTSLSFKEVFTFLNGFNSLAFLS
jgi:hypothetical protein